MVLAGFQRKYLRGLAHEMKPSVQVGKPGITPEVVEAVTNALAQNELVKVSMRKPPDKKTMAADLAERTDSILCGLVGHMIILYRRHPDTPAIRVPNRPAIPDENT